MYSTVQLCDDLCAPLVCAHRICASQGRPPAGVAYDRTHLPVLCLLFMIVCRPDRRARHLGAFGNGKVLCNGSVCKKYRAFVMREVADSAWEDRSLLTELLHAASMPSASTRCKVAVRAVTRWSATLLVTISWHQECTDQHGRMRAARGLTTVLLERASLLLYNVPEAAALPAAAACVLLDNPLLDEPEHSMCAARPAHRPGGAWPAYPCLARWLLLCYATGCRGCHMHPRTYPCLSLGCMHAPELASRHSGCALHAAQLKLRQTVCAGCCTGSAPPVPTQRTRRPASWTC